MMEKTNEMIEKMGNLNVTFNVEFNDKFLMLLLLKALKELREDGVKVMGEMKALLTKLVEEFDLPYLDLDYQSNLQLKPVTFDFTEYVKEYYKKTKEVAEVVEKYVEGHEWKGKYADIIREASERFGFSQKLLACMIQTLSGFDPKAESPTGSKGLMMLSKEIIPDSWEQEDPFNPKRNIIFGALHLYNLWEKYHGNLRKALAAYYAGEEVADQSVLPTEVRVFVDVVMDTMWGKKVFS